MRKSSEFISNLYKDRHKNLLPKNHLTSTVYGDIKIDSSTGDLEYERIELTGENFMYIKAALISKVIDEKEGNK
jgi:hypothetical protein